MLIGYGYGYPKPLFIDGIDAAAWAEYNNRANTDNAVTAEAAVYGCLFNRFAAIYSQPVVNPNPPAELPETP